MRIRLLPASAAVALLALSAAALPRAGSPAAPPPPAAPAASAVPAGAPFDALFEERTMRLDLSHSGGKGTESVTLDRVLNDGPWAGRRARLADDLGLGDFRFRVLDAASGRLLFAEGYSSLYAEWETTGEAKAGRRTFSESLRFPWPKRPVDVHLERRDERKAFRPLAAFRVDPQDPEVNPAAPTPSAPVETLLESGPVSSKVDLLVLGEGYAREELGKLRADARRMVDLLFRHEPFRSRKGDFNVRLLELPSPSSGVHRPSSGVFRRSPLSFRYGIFGTERYVLSTDDRALRDAASGVPYEAVEVLLNDARYGGGGVYNHQATAAVDTAFAEYVFVHEFGHHFAGLADEYYTSDVAYETGKADLPEPWEPNVTSSKERASIKWGDLVEPGTPLPTPWEKEAFEKQAHAFQAERKALLAKGASPAEIDAVFRRQQADETKLLGGGRFAGKVGAFEGASYEAKGLYRPSADCTMFTRDEVGFCPVCRRAVSRVIDWRTAAR